MRWPRLPTVGKELTCPACGDVVATAVYRPWPGRLDLTSPQGGPLAPTRGEIEVRLAAQAVSTAPRRTGSAPRERLRYARSHVEELFHDLRCRRGQVTVVTVPHLVTRLRRTAGRWVPAA